MIKLTSVKKNFGHVEVLKDISIEINEGEILNILEGDLKIVSPSEERNDIECFMQKNIWNNINRQIEEYFDSVTLEALVKDYIEGKIAIMYYI